MGDATGNIYYSRTTSSRTSPSRQPHLPGEQNILPQVWEAQYHPFLTGSEAAAENISVQFMHSCASQDATQLDSDILPRRLTPDGESTGPATPCNSLAYPESSQRTTSNVLSPQANDPSRFHDVSPCDLAALHIADAPLHGMQMFRRGSWPSHAHAAGHPAWSPSPPWGIRSSPVSEPPESTSDESFQDSDGEEPTQMLPMMSQFQVHSSWHPVDIAPHHMYRAQALQPSVMTFQLSDTMLQPVDDPENRHMLHSLLNMNIVRDNEPEVMRGSPSSTLPSLSSFGSANLQGPSGMRLQHDGADLARTSQFGVPVSSTHKPGSPTHSPVDPDVGDQRPSDAKQQKKSKMHQCQQCKKLFPRPSGLATHMNTHSGAKPYKCLVPNCEKSFAVRSNAKRHLRTHGLNPASPGLLPIPRYAVGFEKPLVTQVHDVGKQPSRYKWITHNLPPHESGWYRAGPSASAIDDSSRLGMTFDASMSSATSSALPNCSDEDYDDTGYSGLVDGQQHRHDEKDDSDGFLGYPGYGAHP